MHKSRFEQKVSHKKTFQLYIAKSYDIRVFGKHTAKPIKGVMFFFKRCNDISSNKPNVTVGKLILQRL